MRCHSQCLLTREASHIQHPDVFCVNGLENDPDSCDKNAPGASEEDVMKFSGIACKAGFAYFAYCALIAMRLLRLGRPMPLWTRPFVWLQSQQQAPWPNKFANEAWGGSAEALKRHYPIPSPKELELGRCLTHGLLGGLLVAFVAEPFKLYRLSQTSELSFLLVPIDISLLWMMTQNATVVVGTLMLMMNIGAPADQEREESATKSAMDMPLGLTRAEKDLWTVFLEADTDGNGSVDMHEFKRILTITSGSHKYDFKAEELDDLLEELDKDGSGELDWDEFRKIAEKLHMLRLPETSLLSKLLMLEIGLWAIVFVTLLPCKSARVRNRARRVCRQADPDFAFCPVRHVPLRGTSRAMGQDRRLLRLLVCLPHGR